MAYWTVHLDEYSDHFLLRKPPPEGMAKGVPYLERAERDMTPSSGKKGGADRR